MDILYDVLFSPRAALRVVVEQRLTKQALWVFFFSVLLSGSAFLIGTEEAGALGRLLFFVYVAWSFLMWVGGSALMHLVAEWYGGNGRATDMFATLGFVQLPRIIALPLLVTASFLPPAICDAASATVFTTIFFWVLILHITALEAVYDFTAKRAFAVLFTIYAAVGAIVVGGGLFILLGTVSVLGE